MVLCHNWVYTSILKCLFAFDFVTLLVIYKISQTRKWIKQEGWWHNIFHLSFIYPCKIQCLCLLCCWKVRKTQKSLLWSYLFLEPGPGQAVFMEWNSVWISEEWMQWYFCMGYRSGALFGFSNVEVNFGRAVYLGFLSLAPLAKITSSLLIYNDSQPGKPPTQFSAILFICLCMLFN